MLSDNINAGLINLSSVPNIGQCPENVCGASIANKNMCCAFPELEKILELVYKLGISGATFPHGGCVWREEGEGIQDKGFEDNGF